MSKWNRMVISENVTDAGSINLSTNSHGEINTKAIPLKCFISHHPTDMVILKK